MPRDEGLLPGSQPHVETGSTPQMQKSQLRSRDTNVVRLTGENDVMDGLSSHRQRPRTVSPPGHPLRIWASFSGGGETEVGSEGSRTDLAICPAAAEVTTGPGATLSRSV